MSTATTKTSDTSSTADQAKEAAQQAASKVQDAAQSAAEQASEQAHRAAGQGKDRVRSEVDRRSTEFGERATGTADDLRSISGQLREQGNDQPAQLAEQIAEQVERFGKYLRSTDGDALLHDIEDAARRRPWTVIAGGLAVGFVASRLLKASSSDRYTQRNLGNGSPSQGRSARSFESSGTRTTGTAVPGSHGGASSPLDDLATSAERLPAAQPPAGDSGGAGTRAHGTAGTTTSTGTGTTTRPSPATAAGSTIPGGPATPSDAPKGV